MPRLRSDPITCAGCLTTAPSADDMLTHIRCCKKHPLAHALRELHELRDAVLKATGPDGTTPDEVRELRTIAMHGNPIVHLAIDRAATIKRCAQGWWPTIEAWLRDKKELRLANGQLAVGFTERKIVEDVIGRVCSDLIHDMFSAAPLGQSIIVTTFADNVLVAGPGPYRRVDQPPK